MYEIWLICVYAIYRLLQVDIQLYIYIHAIVFVCICIAWYKYGRSMPSCVSPTFQAVAAPSRDVAGHWLRHSVSTSRPLRPASKPSTSQDGQIASAKCSMIQHDVHWSLMHAISWNYFFALLLWMFLNANAANRATFLIRGRSTTSFVLFAFPEYHFEAGNLSWKHL